MNKTPLFIAAAALSFTACSHTDESAALAEAEREQVDAIAEARTAEQKLAREHQNERQDLAREHLKEAAQGEGSREEYVRERNDVAMEHAEERAETRSDNIEEVAEATTEVAASTVDLAADKVKFKEEILARLQKIELRASSTIQKAKVSPKSNEVKTEVVKSAQELQNVARDLMHKLPETFKGAGDRTWTVTKEKADAQVENLEERASKLDSQV